MRVLRIITTIEPDVGGPSHSAVNAAIAEQPFGVRTTFVFTGEPATDSATAPARARLDRAGVRWHGFRRLPFAPVLARRWGLSPGLVWWVLRNARRFDLIHVHYVWPLGSIVGVIAGRLCRRPVVMTAHESLTRFDIEASRSPMRRRQKLAVRSLLLRNVHTVIAASCLELEDSLEAGEAGVVIPHPVIESAGRLEGVADLEVSGRFTIACLGRLHPKKNVDVILDALSHMPPCAHLIVAGEGPPDQTARLHDHALDVQVEDRVEWRGFVDADGRAKLLAECDVLTMPSAYECFGMVAAEAMASGLPVVVSKSTGVAHIVERYGAGAVVDAGDALGLATALAALMDAPEERDVAARNALRAAEENFSFEAYGRAVSALYDRLAS